MKKHIPNIITLGNLTCGLISIYFAFSDTPWVGAYFIFGGLFLDFFDGFFARILKVDGELGKQLDSLADMVTFGVAPGMLMFETIRIYWHSQAMSIEPCSDDAFLVNMNVLPFLAFLIPVLSAVRLAKFNISTNQSDEFIGLPTPANAVFFAAGVLVLNGWGVFGDIIGPTELREIPYGGKTELFFSILSFSILPFSLLLNAKIRLIALKFKDFGWKGNEFRYIFLVNCLVAIIVGLLISNLFVSIPIIILLYLIISMIKNISKAKK